MRHLLLVLLISSLTAVPALAQVTVDLRALDALPNLPGAPAHRPSVRLPAARAPVAAASPSKPAAARVATAQPGSFPTPHGATTPAALPTEPTRPGSPPAAPQPPPAGPQAPPAATIPAAPPTMASIPPVPTLAPPAAAPPAPPVVTSAATTAANTGAGLRLTFAAGQSDLSPASAASIKHLVQQTPHSDTTSYDVLAYATGDPNDPSVARRMSLARGLSVRTALLADGVPSSRIYLRALGAQHDSGGPLDRVDIQVHGAGTAASATQQ